MLPLTATMMPTARITPKLTSRFGARNVCVTGLVSIATGLTVISRVGVSSSYWLLVAGLIPLGVGMGAAMTPATAAITEGLAADGAQKRPRRVKKQHARVLLDHSGRFVPARRPDPAPG